MRKRVASTDANICMCSFVGDKVCARKIDWGIGRKMAWWFRWLDIDRKRRWIMERRYTEFQKRNGKIMSWKMVEWKGKVEIEWLKEWDKNLDFTAVRWTTVKLEVLDFFYFYHGYIFFFFLLCHKVSFCFSFLFILPFAVHW